MENWGLVTYRETALLIDPKNSSSKSKQWVALVVGHELAHQWFGNLVTMVSLSDWTVIGTNRHMKSNVSLLDDGHLVVMYYPLFLNIPEGIFFCWFRPFSKFLQKNSFLWVRVRVRVRVYLHEDFCLTRQIIISKHQNMVDCNMFLFKKLFSKLYWIYSCVSRNGGLTCGSMRALPPGLNTSVWTTASPSLTFGHSSWTRT